MSLPTSTQVEIRVNGLIAHARRLWSYRELVLQLVWREVGQRYRGSFLGTLWSVINPLILIAIYTVVFGIIFRSRWQGDAETPPAQFALILFAGLAAFNVFSEVANRAPTLILNVPNYVKKVVFPLEILPIVALGTALYSSLIAVGLVLAGSLLVTGQISATVVFLPLAYVPLCLLSLALGWLLASLGVFIRDIGQGMALVVQVLFFLSPVFFPVTSVPERLRPIYALNPLTYILEAFRATLIWGQIPDMSDWAIWTTVTSTLAIVGYIWFMRTKKAFADVL